MSTAERAFPKQLKKDANTALANIVVVFFNLADTYMCLMHYSQARTEWSLFKKQRKRRINLSDPPELERIENKLQKNSFQSVHYMH